MTGLELFKLPEPANQLARCGSNNEAEAQRGLANLMEDVERASWYVLQGVSAMRAAGHSWAVIAKQLGTTRQAAQQRFGRVDARPGQAD